MTDQLKALKALAETVKAGDIDTDDTAADYITAAFDKMSEHVNAYGALGGSLVGAVALVKSTLPGWDWGVTASEGSYVSPTVGNDDGFAGDPGCPARSLLLAAIKGKISVIESAA